MGIIYVGAGIFRYIIFDGGRKAYCFNFLLGKYYMTLYTVGVYLYFDQIISFMEIW